MAITAESIIGTGCALIPLTSIIVIVRFANLACRPKELKSEDYVLFVAYVFFFELTILYILVTPVIFRLAAVEEGEIEPYPTIMQDSLTLQKFFFVTTSSLWLCLWMVKFSLLSLYKRLLSGRKYIIAWWCTMTFCILVLIASILSSWLSCSSFHAWFTAGACNTPRDQRAEAISLYFSFAVDVSTDLMIMILPLRLIWNLQMTLTQKRSVGALFCIGWVCIIVAIIRIVEIDYNYSNSGTPSPAWLALWGIIESSIAVIIGCCPGLYRFIKSSSSKSDPSYRYNSYGFQWNSTSGMPSHRSHVTHGREITLSQMPSKVKGGRTSGAQGAGANSFWNNASSSQEKLAEHPDGENIMITQRVSITIDSRGQ